MPLHVVVGASGQIGSHVMRELTRTGANVRGTTRSSGDIGNAADATRICEGASVVYACFGGPQVTWHTELPRMTKGLLAGAARAGAKVVFADNLYAYGPQDAPLVETTALEPRGPKQHLRAEIADMFRAADRRGDVPVAIARASDLYGPGIVNAMLNRTLVATARAGRRVFLPGDLDAPHTFSFVPDVARAMVQLGRSTTAWGQTWHLPSAPARSLRGIVATINELAGSHSRIVRLPMALVRVVGLFNRTVREMVEMSFQWDRPYLVSHAKFAAAFDCVPTPLDDGLARTLTEM